MDWLCCSNVWYGTPVNARIETNGQRHRRTHIEVGAVSSSSYFQKCHLSIATSTKTNAMNITIPASVDATFQKHWLTWSPFLADMRNDASPFSSANLLCCTALTAVKCFKSSMIIQIRQVAYDKYTQILMI